MRTDFSPKLFMIPILPIIGAGIGLAQSIFGHSREKKALKGLERMQTPMYGGSTSIMDYYNKALQRANQSPYQSQQYQQANQLADRSQAAGVNSLQSRNSAVGGISRLSAVRNNAGIQAGVQAENEQSRRMNELGQAAGVKAQDDLTQFQYNKVAPYEKNYNLLAMKAGSGGQMMNAGISNIFGAIGAANDNSMIKKMYGK